MFTGKLGVGKLGSFQLAGNAFDGNATSMSVLALAQTALCNAQAVSASSTLTLTTTSSAPKFFVKSANSTLSLAQTAHQTFRLASATSALSLGSTAAQRGPISKSATNLIVLDDDAANHIPISLSIVSTLAVAHTATQRGPISRSLSVALSLMDTADINVKKRSVTQAATLTQTAVGARVKRASNTITLSQTAINGKVQASATSALSLVSQARNTNILEVIPASAIGLTQQVTSNIKMQQVAAPIALAQTLDVRRPFYVTPSSPLVTIEEVFDPTTVSFIETETGLTQTVSFQLVKVQRITHFLQLTSAANGYASRASGISKTATSTISLTHVGRISKPKAATSPLSLGQAVVAYLSNHQPESTLSLAQTATSRISRAAFSLANVLVLKHALAFTLEFANSDCQYSPFIGSTTDPNAPTPPPATINEPLGSIVAPFQLVWPSIGAVTDSVTLRAPNLGNVDRLAFDRVVRETRGGTLVVFADPIWPKIQTLVLSFSAIKPVVAKQLLTFMRTHIGQEIGLIDWEKRFWKGVISTPDDPIVQDRENSYSASFEFIGAMDPTWSPQVIAPIGVCVGASAVSQQLRYRSGICSCEGETGSASSQLPYNAEADNTLVVGSPIYLTIAGHAALARADAIATVGVAGLATSDTIPGFNATYISEGQISRSDWTPVTGSVSLTTGSLYYLDPTTAGRLTATAPTTAGQFVLPLGRAVSTLAMDIEIGQRIKL